MILTGETEVPGIKTCSSVTWSQDISYMVWSGRRLVSLKFGQTSETQTCACHTPHHYTAHVQIYELIRILQTSTTATTSLSYFTNSLSSCGLVTLMHGSTKVLARPVHALQIPRASQLRKLRSTPSVKNFVRSTQPPIQLAPWAQSPSEKQPGLEAQQSRPTSAAVKNACSCISTRTYVFTKWCLTF
jgi:hypothetical protein